MTVLPVTVPFSVVLRTLPNSRVSQTHTAVFLFSTNTSIGLNKFKGLKVSLKVSDGDFSPEI